MELDAIRCNIKRLRKLAGITQKEMAAKLFIEERTYSKIERGEQKSMDIRFVASIADILHTEISMLLKDPADLQAIVMADYNAGSVALHPHPDHPDHQAEIEAELKEIKEEIKEMLTCQKEALKLLKQQPE